MTEENKQNVFVYGSLKRGHSANYKLMDQEFLGTAITPPYFRMRQGPAFPYLFLDTQGHSVKGEVYRIDKGVLSDLDQYENYPNFYTRALTKVVFTEGDGEECFADTAFAWIYYNKTSFEIASATFVRPNAEGQLVFNKRVA